MRMNIISFIQTQLGTILFLIFSILGLCIDYEPKLYIGYIITLLAVLVVNYLGIRDRE